MYLYVGSVCHVISLLFASLCYILITRLMFHNIIFMFVFCFVFSFSVLCILCFCFVFVLVCALFLLLCCLFPISVQFHRPLPPGGNPIAVNKYICITYIIYHIIYHIISYVMSCISCHHVISCIISCHHVISCIISYRVSYSIA